MAEEPNISDPGFEQLLSLLVLGELDAGRMAELQSLMAANPAARDAYLRVMEMEAMLHHEFPRTEAIRPENKVKPTRFRPAVIWSAAALIFVSLGLWLYSLRKSDGPVIEAVYGSCIQVDGAGRKRSLRVGEKMEQGSVITEGNDALVRIRFRDASNVVLSGPGEMKIDAAAGKRISLVSGNLDVEMSKQPPGHPAKIETAYAVIEVVGTRFLVDAASKSTTVAVNHGTIRLKRLADGRTIDVADNRMAIASLDAGTSMEARPIASARGAWKATKTQLGDGTFVEGSPSFYQAEAFRAGTGEGGQPIVHYGVSFREPASGTSTRLVRMGADSELKARFRVANPNAYLRIMLVCRDGRGGFIGNRQMIVRAFDVAAGADGWRVFKRKIRDFETITSPTDFSVDQRDVSHLFISVLGSGDGLQIEEVTITD